MDPLDFQHFKDWAFLGLTTGSATLILRYLGKIQKSLERLNVKVAELLQQTNWHSKILDQHENRISRLEGRSPFLTRKEPKPQPIADEE